VIHVLVSVLEDATMALLAVVEETTEDLIDLLADMRIAGLGVSRWGLTSAPRRIELAAELQARPAPLRRRRPYRPVARLCACVRTEST
jgi:hypothetical protein